MRSQIVRSKRWLLPASAVLACAIAAVVPWSTRVDIPVIVEPAGFARVFSPRPARITAIHAVQGQTIEAGTALISLTSDELGHDIHVAETEIARVKAQLARRTADDSDRENSVIQARELASLQVKLQGLHQEEVELLPEVLE